MIVIFPVVLEFINLLYRCNSTPFSPSGCKLVFCDTRVLIARILDVFDNQRNFVINKLLNVTDTMQVGFQSSHLKVSVIGIQRNRRVHG
jgi:hypothetical protein